MKSIQRLEGSGGLDSEGQSNRIHDLFEVNTSGALKFEGRYNLSHRSFKVKPAAGSSSRVEYSSFNQDYSLESKSIARMEAVVQRAQNRKASLKSE